MPIYRLTDELIFPNPELAKEGLLAIGGDLSPERLLLAYSNGIFPWPYGEGYELTWFSPEDRLVLYPENLHISKRLRRTLQGKFTVTMDTQFSKVIRHCAEVSRKHESGTWITQEMQKAYTHLHELGLAHSVETWLNDELVGGIYGISLGGAFFGESMFHLVSDASKVALVHLIEKIKSMNFDFLDAQVHTDHLVSLGAEEIPRAQYLSELYESLRKPTQRGIWKANKN